MTIFEVLFTLDEKESLEKREKCKVRQISSYQKGMPTHFKIENTCNNNTKNNRTSFVSLSFSRESYFNPKNLQNLNEGSSFSIIIDLQSKMKETSLIIHLKSKEKKDNEDGIVVFGESVDFNQKSYDPLYYKR